MNHLACTRKRSQHKDTKRGFIKRQGRPALGKQNSSGGGQCRSAVLRLRCHSLSAACCHVHHLTTNRETRLKHTSLPRLPKSVNFVCVFLRQRQTKERKQRCVVCRHFYNSCTDQTDLRAKIIIVTELSPHIGNCICNGLNSKQTSFHISSLNRGEKAVARSDPVARCDAREHSHRHGQFALCGSYKRRIGKLHFALLSAIGLPLLLKK